MPQNFIKFYGNDWRSDPRLRMCSAAARGVWIDLLTFMMEAEPIGYLLVNGRQPTPEQIGMLTCTPAAVVKKAIVELEGAGVFSRDERGVIYSRRMVRDVARSEEGRQWVEKRWGKKRGATGQGDSRGREEGNSDQPTSPNSPPNTDPNSPPNRPPTTQKPEARSQKPNSDPDGSAAVAAPDDPIKALFDAGVVLLTQAGKTETKARSLLGKWRKELADDERLMGLIVAASKAHKVDPVGWLTKAVRGEAERAKNPNGSAWI